LGESDSVIAHKVVSAFEAGLIPIVCVGETAEEKIAGKTKEVVDRQLRSAFSLLVAGMEKGGVAYVAYEPVWSISTNQKAGLASTVDTPSSAQTVVRYLEGVARGMPIEIRFLYGGSVDSKNLASFLACPEFQGVLVGGASLKPTEVKAMTEIVESFH
jgi:triosephosphate isomerase